MKRTLLLKKFAWLLKREMNLRQKFVESYDWLKYARPSQLPPKGNWRIWLILAGRGFGKTRAGAETLRTWIKKGFCRRLALVGETEKDVRQVMVEGESGLLNIHPPSEKPRYESSKHQLIWPNGAIATCFSGQSYERLRGPQFDGAWVDELAKFKEGEKLWDQLMFSLRLGVNPRAIVTTTPRPKRLVKRLLKDPAVIVTRGSTFENVSNLAAPFLDFIKRKYEQTSLGRQELYAELIEDHKGALWSRFLLEQARQNYKEHPLERIVISIDPAVSHGEKSDETGIIATGITMERQGVVLEDLSLKGRPSEWIQRAVEAYHRLKADRIIAEVNMGGDLVEQLLRTYDPSVSYRAVRASRGKVIRAEPIAALYEQGKVWHKTYFHKLDEQLCTYIPGVSKNSPDRLDALVWGLTNLMIRPLGQQKLWVR